MRDIGGARDRCQDALAHGRGDCSRWRWRRPADLKVQTIHAFCTSLLHLFPFEANVAARFNVLDETAETQTAQRADDAACCLTRRRAPTARSAARSPGPSPRRPTSFESSCARRSAGVMSSPPGSIRRASVEAAVARALPKPRHRSVRQRDCRRPPPCSTTSLLAPIGMAGHRRSAGERLEDRQRAGSAL